jgi:hypothetical protein
MPKVIKKRTIQANKMMASIGAARSVVGTVVVPSLDDTGCDSGDGDMDDDMDVDGDDEEKEIPTMGLSKNAA